MKFLKKNRRKIFIALVIVVSVFVVGNLSVMAASALVESRSIGIGNAVELSLYDANVNEADTEITKAKLTLKNGKFIYTVKFRSGSLIYEYEIAADDGTILNSGTLPYDQGQSGGTEAVTLEQAKNIALENAGLSAEDVTFSEARLDSDDGKRVYEISFYLRSETELCFYEYDISENDGTVSEFKISRRLNTFPEVPESPAGNITGDDAINAALSDAGLSPEKAENIRVSKDVENFAAVFEVKFTVKDGKFVTEYEYEILEADGTVLSSEIEGRKTAGSVSSGESTDGSAISIESAKEIALKDAGLTSEQVYFKKAKLDRSDGRSVYEVEFICNGYEYEYEIDRNTGAIIERDIERDD